jgi:hypothetical protein
MVFLFPMGTVINFGGGICKCTLAQRSALYLRPCTACCSACGGKAMQGKLPGRQLAWRLLVEARLDCAARLRRSIE